MNGKEWHPGTAASADKGYCGFAASEIYIFGILLFLQGDNGSNAFRQFHIAFGCVAAEADPFVVCLALVQCEGATAKGNACNGFGIDDLMETDAFVTMLGLVLTEYDVGTIPVSLDRVTCGSIDRVCKTGIPHLLVLGVNDGVLPSAGEGGGIRIDLNQPMEEVRKELSKYPVATRVSLSGTIIVARDIAHAKLKERLDSGEGLPEYIKNHPVLYAGPAKTPAGMPCGSMGPTTAGRMDPYVDLFQENGGSLVMIAKGNRSQVVTDACKKHGGFYLGSIGGPAAILSQQNIKSIECVEYPELGMEAVWKIEVTDFPAFILVDDKGNDFFQQIKPRTACQG